MISRNININDVWSNLNHNWDIDGLAYNPGLTVSLIHAIPGDWDWKTISSYIDVNEIISHPNEPWDLLGMSYNKGLTASIVISYGIDREWDWPLINMTMHVDEIIKLHAYGGQWSKPHLSANETLTYDVMNIMHDAKGEWNWEIISHITSIGTIGGSIGYRT